MESSQTFISRFNISATMPQSSIGNISWIMFFYEDKTMWTPELELTICENELDILMLEMSNNDNDDDEELFLSPSITHLGFKGQLLHALHLLFSFFESWIPSFKL